MIKRKKIKVIISLLITLFIFLIYKDTNAASASISASTTSAYVGDYVSVTVNYYATTWNLVLSGSIKDTEVGYNPNAVDTGGSRSWQLNTSSPGTYTVYLSGDVSGSNDSWTNVGGSVTVTVSQRPVVVTPPSNPTPSNNTNTNTNTNTNNNPNNNTQTPAEQEKSKNNKLKELTSDYGKITKVDDNNYTLEVPSSIAEITLKATPEDTKATVTGDGKHKVATGTSTIEIIITSESGEQNKIVISVTKKDSYSLEDLDTLLSTSTDKELSFKITTDSKITIPQLTSIKNSGKKVSLDYYDSNNQMIYSWIIDGTKIDNIEEMSTKVSFKSKYEKEIKELLNGKESVLLTLSNENHPKGTRLRVYVGDNYKDNAKVKIYCYNKETNKLELVTSDKVKGGYVEFDVSKGSYFAITKDDSEEKKQEEKSSYIGPIIFLGFSLLVFIIAIVVYKKKTKNK